MAFLYVIARDGSVRMVDVFNPGSERECETNIDPLGTPETAVARNRRRSPTVASLSARRRGACS